MAEVRGAQGLANFRLAQAADAHVVFHPIFSFRGKPSLIVRCDLVEGTPEVRVTFGDEDGWTQLFADAEVMVRALREATAQAEVVATEVERLRREAAENAEPTTMRVKSLTLDEMKQGAWDAVPGEEHRSSAQVDESSTGTASTGE